MTIDNIAIDKIRLKVNFVLNEETMTKEEIIMQLMKLDIDFEIIHEHDDGMHVLIKFHQEKEKIKKVYITKKLGLAIDGFAE